MVKCADCGFLALRSGRSELLEATASFRQSGTPEHLRELDLYMQPLCFARAFNLQAEIRELDQQRSETEPHRQSLAVIGLERPCKRYTEWQQGFTPKEHQEKLDRDSDRRWRLIEIALLVVLAGAFTIPGRRLILMRLIRCLAFDMIPS